MAAAFLRNRVFRIPVLLVLILALGGSAFVRRDASAHQLPVASVARTLSVRDTVSTHLIGHKGATVLHESGRAAGTLSCSSLTIQINISYTHAYITFSCPTSAGTVSGQGETSFYASGSLAYFHGYLRITHGTGRYSHSAGSNLYITGKLYRGSYAIGGTVSGSLRL